jgi:hypothetical protein
VHVEKAPCRAVHAHLCPDLDARDQELLDDGVHDEPCPHAVRGQEDVVALEQRIHNLRIGDVADEPGDLDPRVRLLRRTARQVDLVDREPVSPGPDERRPPPALEEARVTLPGPDQPREVGYVHAVGIDDHERSDPESREELHQDAADAAGTHDGDTHPRERGLPVVAEHAALTVETLVQVRQARGGARRDVDHVGAQDPDVLEPGLGAIRGPQVARCRLLRDHEAADGPTDDVEQRQVAARLRCEVIAREVDVVAGVVIVDGQVREAGLATGERRLGHEGSRQLTVPAGPRDVPHTVGRQDGLACQESDTPVAALGDAACRGRQAGARPRLARIPDVTGWTLTVPGHVWTRLSEHLFPGDGDEHGAVLATVGSQRGDFRDTWMAGRSSKVAVLVAGPSGPPSSRIRSPRTKCGYTSL